MKSGFVSVVGRPNVGKSTLVNQICGLKVSIVSDKPQTTRVNVRGVMNRPGSQLVFVDTPGLHKPVTALGERLNASASEALSGVDVVCFVLDATKPFGKGDKWVASRVPKDVVIVVNKTDIASPEAVLAQLTAASSIDASAFFPISAATGAGVDALLDHLIGRMQEGPQFYPDDMLTDQPEAVRVAELVREQLLALTEQELPYSIATRVSEWEWPRVRCEILVERDSQKGMVIGKKGALLKAVGIAVRQQMPPGAYLELFVKVDKNWQHRPDRVERLLGEDGD
jgi:GTPase